MNWEDERWVKLYTRDSVTWLTWTWQAQFVMMSLLRKVDRAGVVDVGCRGVEGLAALLRIPVDIVRDGVAVLTEPDTNGESTVVWRDDQVVVVKFIDAQDARSSNAQRQRELRERRRDFASRGVTNSVTTSSQKIVDTDDDRPVRSSRTVTSPLANTLEDLDDSSGPDRNGALPTALRTPAEVVTPRVEESARVARDVLSEVLAHFARHYVTANGRKPSPPTRAQKTRLRALIDAHGDHAMRDTITRAYVDPPDWPKPPYDLAAILQHFDRFVASRVTARPRRANGSLHDAVMSTIDDDRDVPAELRPMPWEIDL